MFYKPRLGINRRSINERLTMKCGQPTAMTMIGMDRSLQHCWCSYSAKLHSSKVIGSLNPDISASAVPVLLNRLYRLPVCEPDGQIVYFRSRGIHSGLFYLVQAVEDLATQWSSLRAEVDYFASRGEWYLTALGTLADDGTEGGFWSDLHDFYGVRVNPSGLCGLELDPFKSEFGTKADVHCLGYRITQHGTELPKLSGSLFPPPGGQTSPEPRVFVLYSRP